MLRLDSLRLSAFDYDEPEPRLAMLGPPAVTRLMFELWRTAPRLRARFDLADPLHRRDFAVWLLREGRSLGLNEQPIATIAAILHAGASLRRVPPRWPAQARVVISSNVPVDAWLAAPITCESIPLPRVLALLWELRQDVRLHFRNRTRRDVLNYLAWCLTQGIRDGCVPVELTEPALAGFLDTADPEFGVDFAEGPPVTRLLRIMAPLYDGPHPEIARDFPRTRKSRLCLSIWACGALRRRFGWPKRFVYRPLRWLTAPRMTDDAFLPLDNLVFGLWELRPDLQAECNLRTHEGRTALLEWFTSNGLREFELEDCVSSPLSARLAPLRHSRPERARAVATKAAIKRDLCLVGYANLVSGRAEDMRMSAVALGRLRRPFAMLDRLSGAITDEDGRTALAFADPPRINLVHLNADTAFFDYLFLRERGIEGGYTIGYWTWELAKFPEAWKSSFAFVQEVWTASRFAYDAIAPVATKPVVLMPMAVAIPPPEPGLKRSDFGLPSRSFIFFFSFDFRSYASRKNPLAAVAAFRKAFPDLGAAAFLLLKTIGSDWKAEGRDRLVEAVRGDPRIMIIDREFARPRAMALLALSDCFVSLHRSEGFGRGPAEAMLLGKPVIVTDYSGTRDFASRETALLVGYDLVAVGAEEYPGADGQVWAEPDIDEAAAAMRQISSDRALAARLGHAGRARIRRLYDPGMVGARYLDRLNAITKAI